MTVSAAAPLIAPTVAVIVALPTPAPVAVAPDIVATLVLELVHVAEPVTSAVDPSLYVPVAVNACVDPTPIDVLDGETEIDESAGTGLSGCQVQVIGYVALRMDQGIVRSVPASFFTPMSQPSPTISDGTTKPGCDCAPCSTAK